MCGICGVVELGRPIDRVVLERMTRTLAHRGPDVDGYYVSSDRERGPTVGLGFRRLSIIDVAGGHQPLSNEDGSVWVICNGEIYNFRELRRELESRGHRFRSNSDAEVLVHLYEDHGQRLVELINGMFAFALWDESQGVLLLARDRLGEKPLYYAEQGDRLIFGSEPKALLEDPRCPRELDRRALAKYLAFEYVPLQDCIFEGVRKLSAAHCLLWQGGRTAVERYWKLPGRGNRDGRPVEDIADELVDRLRESVRLRLMSDVPLGVFLSGGLDSTSVVALMSELIDPREIRTFSIGFEEGSFDESTYARRVAEHYGTNHHEETLTPKTMLSIFPEVARFLDEPFADASVIPTYLLSKFTRESVTVALGGDGADELFAGYPTFVAHRLADWYRVPRWLHESAIAPAVRRLPVSTDNFSYEFKAKQFLRGVGEPAPLRDQLWLGSFSPQELDALLIGGSPCDPYGGVVDTARALESQGSVNRLIALYVDFYLQGDILVKVDRASMAASLEVRAPFLDHTFVEFVSSLPQELKLRGLRGKYLLRRAMAPKLPRETLERGKKGFGIPVARWLKGELRSLLRDLLSHDRLKRQGIFEPATVQGLVDEHLTGRKDNRKKLWTLVMFQLWYETYYDVSSSTREPTSPTLERVGVTP